MVQASPKSRFEFTGGMLCLDFADTVNNRTTDHPEELLTDYPSLVKWGEEAGILTPKNVERLHQHAVQPGSESRRVLAVLLFLRS